MSTAALPQAAERVTRVPLFALLAANAVSMTGNMMYFVAVPWFVLQTTGSASKAGISAFTEAAPVVLAAFLGGTLVDRLGHRNASVLSDLATALTIGLIPLAYRTVGLTFWQLLVLVFVSVLLNAPGATARMALLPRLIEMSRMRPERANSAYQAIFQLALLVGTPLGGIVIAVLGADAALAVDAVSFLLSALILWLLVPSAGARIAHHSDRGRFLAELSEGVRFIRRDRVLTAMIILVTLANFLDNPIFAIILPVYMKETFNSAVPLGLTFSMFGAGALVGTLGYGAAAHRVRRRPVFLTCFIVLGVAIAALALLPPLPVILLITAVAGLSAGPLNPIFSTLVQERTPAEMRGRVFGTLMAAVRAATPLSMLLAGFLVERAGIRITVMGMGVCYLVVTVGSVFVKAFREMDKRPDPSAAAY